jgi:aryl-alcohol dehydrogenase-like predicted oxidoreductase
VTTKHVLGSPPSGEVYQRLSDSLDGSLARMRLEHVDIFILHGMIDVAAEEGATTRTNLGLFRQAVAPAFDRLRTEGRIGAWGITGVGFPSAILDVVDNGPRPAVVQCIANVLDSPGGMKRYEEPARPREIIATAVRNGVAVMGIRAVAAGSLTSGIDRELPPGAPEVIDFERAAPFRAIAEELGVSPAFLAHQYALSMDGISTVVLGVKNREELRECLASEAAGTLSPEVTRRIDQALR